MEDSADFRWNLGVGTAREIAAPWKTRLDWIQLSAAAIVTFVLLRMFSASYAGKCRCCGRERPAIMAGLPAARRSNARCCHGISSGQS
jgi:hypothetical protein